MDKLIGKLLLFQKTTGVHDIDSCVETLEACYWDFDVAVSSLSCKSTSTEESIGGESFDLITKEPSGFRVFDIFTMFFNAINCFFSINSKSQVEAEAEAAKFSEAVKFVIEFERENGSNYWLKFLPRSLTDAKTSSLLQNKFIFVYLHSPLSPDTPSFCKKTLSCETLGLFLNESFVVWGGNIDSIDGKYLCKRLNVSRFPFCAVVRPITDKVTDDGFVIHYKVDRAISAKDLLMLMLKLFEARDPQAVYDPKLRNEKEAAYVAALIADKARHPKTTETLERVRIEVAAYEREVMEDIAASEEKVPFEPAGKHNTTANAQNRNVKDDGKKKKRTLKKMDKRTSANTHGKNTPPFTSRVGVREELSCIWEEHQRAS